MLKRLTVKNFGPYENASITFEPFTAILGANGTGKSLIFTALRCLGRIARFPLRYPRPDPGGSRGGYPTRTGQVDLEDILHRRDTARTMELAVEIENERVSGTYEVHVRHWQNPAGVIVQESLNMKSADASISVVAHADGSVDGELGIPYSALRTPRFLSIPSRLYKSRDLKESALGSEIQQALWDRIAVYRFDPTALKTPSDPGKQGLAPTGYNFPTYLDEIRNQPGGRAAFDALLNRFRGVCPHVEDILLPLVDEPSGANARKSLSMVMSAQKAIPADLESDGTILLLAYASLLHGPKTYDTICVEEPENGIHPRAAAKLAQMLKELADDRGPSRSQVLLCTHSLPLLECFQSAPETLRLVRRGGDGRSTVEVIPAAVLPSVAGWAGLTTG